MTIQTRFAPSPTGFLHIGGARTALFCHLHARHHGGRCFLRIEDTDRERSTQEAVGVILEGLEWLGLTPDGETYYQSAHAADHIAAAQRLLDQGKAYRCYCSKEELDALREEQRARNEKPRYDGRCLANGPSNPEAPYVIRFRTPQEGEVAWDDLIQGTIHYPNQELDDLVLVRSDGTPTYNLAVVVDDHAMGVNLVLRGEDHLSNTPRQIHLWHALGWTPPAYAHMPLLHGSDGAKLSKRHGAVSVLQYRDEGFLPEAVNNYLARLGWSHGEQEVFTMAELVQHFDASRLGRSAAIFDLNKLLWLNGQHIQRATPARLAKELPFHLRPLGIENPDPAYLEALIPTLQERSKTLVEMAQRAKFYLVESVEPYDPKAVAKHIHPDVVAPFSDLAAALEELGDEGWHESAMEGAFKEVIERHGLKMGKLAQPLRLALTGTDTSPSIYDVLRILGRERAMGRIRRGVAVFSGDGG